MHHDSKPLTDREIISDGCLHRLMADEDGSRKRGRLSEIDEGILCVILPDLCAELISRRTAFYQQNEAQHKTVKSAALRRLALDRPGRAQGQLNTREHRFLSLTLPAICHELLELRVAMTISEVA